MSAIALPMVAPSAAATSGDPVNIETGVVTFFRPDLQGVGAGTNPPDPISYSGYPRFEIRFKVNINARTGNTDEVVWLYPDQTARDDDYALLLARTTTTLV